MRVASEIVGRNTELDAVERFLDGLERSPAALVLEGEPGIGKTTLWLAALEAARARSFRLLRARPAESETKLSYAALADLVGDDFDVVRASLPAPQERALAAALLRGETAEPADARTTATAFVSVLGALAADGPVLVAVDDVQWLDAATGRVLAFAARRLPPATGLVLTRRTDGDLELPLGLARSLPEADVTRIVPTPLSLGALHHLIRDRLGTDLARPTLARIAAASGGNPFFALELGRAAATGAEPEPAGPLRVPPNLRELVAARVGTLSPAAREAVLLAAGAARPTVALVARATGADVGPALAEAESAGVLSIDRGQLRFVHPLLAAAFVASMSASERRELHRRLAAAVDDPEARARHLAATATEPDARIAAELEAAAGATAQRGAQDAAAELYAAAAGLTPPECEADRGRRLLGEASALFAVGDADHAAVLAERATAAPDRETRARAHLLHAEIVWAGGATDDAIAELEDGLAAARGERELEARVRARIVAFQTGIAPEQAVAQARAASRLLRAETEPGLLAYVLFNRFFTEALLGRGARRDLLRRGLELEARAGAQATMSSMPLIWFHSVDEHDAARARHAHEDRWYAERGEEFWRAERLSHLALVELRAGRWQLAERYVDESWARIEPFREGGVWAAPHEVRALVDAHRGRLDRARADLTAQIERMDEARNVWWAALALSALAFVEFAAGDHDAADRALERMRAATDSIGFRDVLPDRSEPNEIESCVARGQVERAREALARLEWRGRVLPRPWIAATLPRSRALVHAASGDLTGALALLDAAAPVPELPFEQARTELVRGRLYRRLKQKRAAAAALESAVASFEVLGAEPWLAQAREELDRVGARRRAPDDLTPTELRVAELAASGLTNRQVAETAFMSAKTVEANLARIYRKLGIHSRAELGARIGRDPAQT